MTRNKRLLGVLVCLLFMLLGCEDPDEITSPPIAEFTADHTCLSEGSTIQFADQSINNPEKWEWYFGEQGVSNLKNPSHSYFLGTFSVTLIVTNKLGSDTITKINYITPVSDREVGVVTDYEGNSYSTVKIGNQWWMSENLKSTHYADGTEIELVEVDSVWEKLNNTKAYCYYDNLLSNKNIYGNLYNWEAAMNGLGSSNSNPSNIQGVCPDGWHLPSDEEWIELELYLGVNENEVYAMGARGADHGRQLKEAGAFHWEDNERSSNKSGFTALPGGWRYANVTYSMFIGKDFFAQFWSSSEYDITKSYGRYLSYYRNPIYRVDIDKNEGSSVRCIKD